eukprot:CAMPEP_0171663252 /NCGR_PEP_ID=MMETSP0990-20121206/46064_1 /TAXON_ID=483369 /ORGANISM="non described non described, Strain CCMP2098" /LENGTH=138 /DNA_ID=CAMNT_0012245877 /DNA_START=234 /DNA_END=652 /DNA_ORIENTATION=+
MIERISPLAHTWALTIATAKQTATDEFEENGTSILQRQASVSQRQASVRQSVSGWRGRGVAPRLHHLHQGLEAGGVGVEAEPRQSVLLVAESRVRRAELRHLTAHTCGKEREKATPTAAGQGDRGVGSEGSEKKGTHV